MPEKNAKYFHCAVSDLFELIKDIAGFERWHKHDRTAFRIAIDDIYENNEHAVLYASLSFSYRVSQATKIVLMGKDRNLAKEEWLEILAKEWGEEWGSSWVNKNKKFLRQMGI